MQDLIDKIHSALDKCIMSPKILLDGFRVIDEKSRLSSAYNDYTYIPFFYYLGKEISPKNMIEVGTQLGLCSGTFLRSCKTVERFLAFQRADEIQFYSPRLGKKNIQDVYKNKFDIYVGDIRDDVFEAKCNKNTWDFVMINEEASYEEHMQYLNFVWERMETYGILIQDRINYHKATGKVFSEFCKIKNREEFRFNTKYGIGLIQK